MSDESIKSLLHFEDGLNDAAGIQTWSKATNEAAVDSTQAKFGSGSLYPNAAIVGRNYSGIWDLNSSGEYEIEFSVYPIAHGGADDTRRLFRLYPYDSNSSILMLSLTSTGQLELTATGWDITDALTSSTALTVNTWSHVMIRVKDETLKVYLNGTEEINAELPEDSTLSIRQALLGYFSDTAYAFYMDEFIFRHSAGTEAPVVPTQAYSGEWPIVPLPSVLSAKGIKSLRHCSAWRDEIGIEDWTRTGSVAINNSIYKFGGGSFYPNAGYMIGTNNSGIWCLNSSGEYEIEFFVYPIKHGGNRYLFQLTTPTEKSYTYSLRLSLDSSGKFVFGCSAWGYHGTDNPLTGTTALTVNTWHHVVLRIAEQKVIVFLDRTIQINADLPENVTLCNFTQVRLGYFGSTTYAFYMDEFVFRYGLSPDAWSVTSAPAIPTKPYFLNLANGGRQNWGDIKCLLRFDSYLGYESSTWDEVNIETWRVYNWVDFFYDGKFGDMYIDVRSSETDGEYTYGYLKCENTSGIFNLSPTGDYEFEFFARFYFNWEGKENSILKLSHEDGSGNEVIDLELKYSMLEEILVEGDEETGEGYEYRYTEHVRLISDTWRINADNNKVGDYDWTAWQEQTSGMNDLPIREFSLFMDSTYGNEWIHVLVRVSSGQVKLYLDGAEYLSGTITTNSTLTPDSVRLGGGYGGYSELNVDEFVFRHSAGTGNPVIPTEAYSLRQVKPTSGAVKSLLHFEDINDEIRLEDWRKGNTKVTFDTTKKKFGSSSLYSNTSYMIGTNDSGIWNLNSSGEYEIEFFVYPIKHGGDTRNLFQLITPYTDGTNRYTQHLYLALNSSGKLVFMCSSWGYGTSNTQTSTNALTVNTWSHVMIRVKDETLKVYLNGAEEISAGLPEDVTINPQQVRLGYFSSTTYAFYMDEFVFRHSAGTEAPTVPTQAYSGEAYRVIETPYRRDFGTIRSLVHFDFPYYNEPSDGLDDEVRGAVWEREGNTKLAGVEIPYEYEGAPKFGYRCAYYPDDTSHVISNNADGVFNLDPADSQECECFVKAETVEEAISTGYILNFGDDLTLSITDGGALNLTSSAWSIDSTSTRTLSADTWHHILLRVDDHTAKVYLDGVQAISTAITGDTIIAPEVVKLGGYVGFMDEFVFRGSAGTKAPIVPTYPYRGRVNNSSVGGYGTGIDGDVTINENTQINSYGIVESIADTQTLTVTSWSNGSVVPAVGTEVMIHITAPKSTDSANYLKVGLYAFSAIAAIDGTTISLTDRIKFSNGFDFTLDSSLLDTYYIQVITVPNYASLTVDKGKLIKPLTWSATKGGGIVAFRCTGDCTINGSILTHGYGATRYDLQQMTNAKLIDRFLCGSGGGIFIACGGTLTAPSTARLGNSTSGLGDGNNGAAGYGGNGGSNAITSGGLGGVGGGGGGSVKNYTNNFAGGDCGNDGNNGNGGGGCGGKGGDASVGGGGGGGQGGSGGAVGISKDTTTGQNSQSGTINGGCCGMRTNGQIHSGAGGGGPGGDGGNGDMYINSTNYGTLKGGTAGANIILITEALRIEVASLSTGGQAGASYTSTNSGLRMGGGGGGGTGFCYIACREQVSDNA